MQGHTLLRVQPVHCPGEVKAQSGSCSFCHHPCAVPGHVPSGIRWDKGSHLGRQCPSTPWGNVSKRGSSARESGVFGTVGHVLINCQSWGESTGQCLRHCSKGFSELYCRFKKKKKKIKNTGWRQGAGKPGILPCHPER